MKIQILTRHCRAVASLNIKILYLRKGDNIMLKFEIKRCNKTDKEAIALNPRFS